MCSWRQLPRFPGTWLQLAPDTKGADNAHAVPARRWPRWRGPAKRTHATQLDTEKSKKQSRGDGSGRSGQAYSRPTQQRAFQPCATTELIKPLIHLRRSRQPTSVNKRRGARRRCRNVALVNFPGDPILPGLRRGLQPANTDLRFGEGQSVPREREKREERREREKERDVWLGFVSRPCASFDPFGRGHFSHVSPRSQACIHLLRWYRQPQPLDKEAGERDAVAGGLLSGQVNHRNRMENSSSKNKTRGALVYVAFCTQQAPACVSARVTRVEG